MNETYRSTKTWSLITIAGLAFVCFFQVLTILIGIGQVLNPDVFLDLDEDGAMSAWFAILGILSIFQLPVVIATIVSFLVWLNRSHKNLLALRPTHLKFSSGWAIGWWFIPFANLVKPFQVMREVWWESDPVIPQDQMFLTESLHAAPKYMGVWWAFWLISNFASNATDKLFDPERTDSVAAAGAAFIIVSSLVIAAAVLAIMVVRDITARQAGRYLAVRELEGKEARTTYEQQHVQS